MAWHFHAFIHLRLLLLTLLFLAGSFLFSYSMLSTSNGFGQKSKGTCSGVKPVDQVVFLLVDALRPDFLLPALTNHYSTGEKCGVRTAKVSERRNGTLKYIEGALRNLTHPSHGFFFFADAPTVTSQRLKALSTGTIPAFLEMAANLNTDEILTDSILYHLRGRSILLGDNTWLNLFPDSGNTSQWKRTVSYPPFNVSDFESNDNIVMKNLIPTLEAETIEKAPADYAKLIIGHFLAVDHVGHTYNADHPEIRRQLTRLDGMFSSLVHFLRHERQSGTRTVLFILGDHGMTQSGDHGGESFSEADSFLYVEFFDGKNSTPDSLLAPPSILEGSLRQKTEQTRVRWRESIDEDLKEYEACQRVAEVHRDKLSAAHQVDLTPTISVLLGVPIPFCSLGRVIPEILALADDKVDIGAVEECNWRQLINYYNKTELKVFDSWMDNGVAFRRRISQMGHFGRKSRNQMNRVGMFFGSCLYWVAAFFLLRNKDLQCAKKGNFLEVWTAVLLFFRLCTVFSNSFIVKEAEEVFCLFQLSLLTALVSSRERRTSFFVLLLLVFMRAMVPLLYHDRSFFTQLVEASSPLEQLLKTYTFGTWWHVIGIVCGGATFCILSQGLFYRLWIAILSVAMVLSYKRSAVHHLVPLASFLLSAFVNKSGLLRYASIVLWVSSLCNEKFTVSAAISVFGALFPTLVQLTCHMSVFGQAVLLHLISWVAFFAQGNHTIFSALDMTAFLVGLSSVHIVLGGFFVVARTFVAFCIVPMAVTLSYGAKHTRGWRVSYLIVCLALLQSVFSCFSCYTHRSHLMLYSIFSPKLIFDLIIFMITFVGYILSIFVIQ